MIRAIRMIVLAAPAIAGPLAHAGPWSSAGPIDGHYTISTHPTVPGVGMIGGGHGSLSTWFSQDGGTTWIGNPWRGASDRPVLAGVPTVAWMHRSPQLLRSTDAGRSWGIVDTGAVADIDGLAVNPVDPAEVVVGGTGGTRHTRNGGATWAADPAAGDIYTLAVDWSARQLYVVNYGTTSEPPPLRRRSLDSTAPWTTLASVHAVAAAR